jgi:hypothetical protein
MTSTRAITLRLEQGGNRRVPALQAEHPVILAADGLVVIEFRCRSASARSKISLKEPGIRGMSI